jgi:hypothetical protein
MNQGVYEVFFVGRLFSLLGNCTNSNIEIVMLACKDKRYGSNFECIRFFYCCKKGQGIKVEPWVLHLKFNMMLIKPICLATIGAI